MKKSIAIILGSLVLLVIIALAVFFWPTPETAEVVVSSGTVELYSAQTDTWEIVTGKRELVTNSLVRTQEGEAIIFLGNLITYVDPYTEISVKELTDKKIHLSQTGSTWNKVVKLIEGQQVVIENPTIVAMVRGTEYGLDDEGLMTAEGEVEVTIDGKKHMVFGGKQLLNDGTMSEMDRAKAREKVEKMLTLLKQRRLVEVNKHPAKVKIMMKAAKMEGTVEEVLDRLDQENVDFKRVRAESPISLKEFERAIVLSEEIKKQQALLQTLSEEKQEIKLVMNKEEGDDANS